MKLYDILKELEIDYREIEHPPVYTIEDIKNLPSYDIDGIGCKNLLLRDKKHNFYLVVLDEDKRANMKDLEKKLDAKKLKFASDEELMENLNLEPGSVTPLGIINDAEHKVVVVFDGDLVGQRLQMHPNVNTRTMSMEWDDMVKFIKHLGNEIKILEMQG